MVWIWECTTLDSSSVILGVKFNVEFDCSDRHLNTKESGRPCLSIVIVDVYMPEHTLENL